MFSNKGLLVVIIVAAAMLAGIVFVIVNSKDTQLNINPENVQVQVEDTSEGTGVAAKDGDTLSVHYVGTFIDGTKFDSSRDRGTPFEVTLGAGQVIPGWEQGIIGMKVGGMRKLTIPPELAYGDKQVGPIPANSTLLFEVELLEIK